MENLKSQISNANGQPVKYETQSTSLLERRQRLERNTEALIQICEFLLLMDSSDTENAIALQSLLKSSMDERFSLALKLADALQMATSWKSKYLLECRQRSRMDVVHVSTETLSSIVEEEEEENQEPSQEMERLRLEVESLRQENAKLSKFQDSVLEKRQQRRMTLMARLSLMPEKRLRSLLSSPTTTTSTPEHAHESIHPQTSTTLTEDDIAALREAGQQALNGHLPSSELALKADQFLQSRRATIAYRRQSVLAENKDVLNKMTAVLDKIGGIEKELSRSKRALSESEQDGRELEGRLEVAETKWTEYEAYFRQMQAAVKNVAKKTQMLQQTYQEFLDKKVKNEVFKEQMGRDIHALQEALHVISQDMEQKQLKMMSGQPPVAPPPPPMQVQQQHPTPPTTPSFNNELTARHRHHRQSAASSTSSQPESTTSSTATTSTTIIRKHTPASSSTSLPTSSTGPTAQLLAEIRNGAKKLRKVDMEEHNRHIQKSIHAVRDIQQTLRSAIDRHRVAMRQTEEDYLNDDLDDWD